jgi:phospholipase/carboxylesterase
VPTGIDTDLREYREWVFRFRPASKSPSRLLLMLHGWTGDENSMWVFSRKLPSHMVVLAPRGPFKAAEGGYSWRQNGTGTWELPKFEDFRSSAEALFNFVEEWSKSEGSIVNQFDLIGFSQGAALSYVMTLLQPQRILALAALSGFLPEGGEGIIPTLQLEGKPIFISHGRQDEMVPVDHARKAVALLENSGAKVSYCETDIGHKVSTECISGLADFFG